MTVKRKIYVAVSWLLVFLCMAFIFSMSAADAEKSSEISNSFLMRIIELTGLEITSHFIRKAAHFCEFALLSFLISNAVFATWKSKKSSIYAFPAACFYAVTDELHQLFSDGRACSFRDMLIDSSGAFLGALVFSVIVLIYNKHIERKKEDGSIKTV